jgi:hypothetical protein
MISSFSVVIKDLYCLRILQWYILREDLSVDQVLDLESLSHPIVGLFKSLHYTLMNLLSVLDLQQSLKFLFDDLEFPNDHKLIFPVLLEPLFHLAMYFL